MPVRLSVLALILMAFPALAEVAQGPKNVPEFTPAFKNQTRAPELRGMPRMRVETIADGLDQAWGVEVLPDGRYLVTERVGRLNLITPGGDVTRVRGVPKVLARGQGGLLDVALAEDFAESGTIYLTYAKSVRGGSVTALARARLDGTTLREVEEIFLQSPPSRDPKHYGSRVVPANGALYLTLGERSNRADRELAQDPGTTYGKVMRITPDGRAELVSLGHRNPQGADIHPGTGELWTLEHGPAGGDELNRIEPGGNYGWPVVSYGENYNGTPIGTGKSSAPGMIEPVYYWDPVIAPGGFAFYDGSLFKGWRHDVVAASLNPGGLVRLKFTGGRVIGEARFLEDLGRMRDVEIDRDGAILALAGGGSSRLVRIVPDG
ncbi:MAG: PQQ-dependent sugar dehydrogenase [Silicimonas sp.]|nr:PQQ-dependent sugar dehydrogenase [Silicimonas sp.]